MKKISAAFLKSMIEREHMTLPNENQTLVLYVWLRNGEMLIGQAHCLHPDQFSIEVGLEVARADVLDKLAEKVAFMIRELDYIDRAAAGDVKIPYSWNDDVPAGGDNAVLAETAARAAAAMQSDASDIVDFAKETAANGVFETETYEKDDSYARSGSNPLKLDETVRSNPLRLVPHRNPDGSLAGPLDWPE
jgi:hypothetical protein